MGGAKIFSEKKGKSKSIYLWGSDCGGGLLRFVGGGEGWKWRGMEGMSSGDVASEWGLGKRDGMGLISLH